ncbi:Nitrogen permease regulator 2 [Malassezia sp. CBS 17886]|nr:Nitrogen permease regulator 2 [Malassezia sp. CBS 17886]
MGRDFLPELKATFLAIFHPVDGPKVLFQMPEDSIAGSGAGAGTLGLTAARTHQRPMLDFASMSDYIIPKPPLCGNLVTCVVPAHSSSSVQCSYKVLGYPVLLQKAERYQRNNFIFNLCFVFDSGADVQSYEPIVRKCGRALRALEEESSFVSRLENLPRLYGIVEQLHEDLNTYYEAFIALPEEHNALPIPARLHPHENLTLVDPNDLAVLIERASGPLARTRARPYRRWLHHPPRALPGVREESSLRDAPPHADSSTDSAERESFASHGPHASAHTSRASSPPRGVPHGLGRTVRDAINLKLFPAYPNPPEVQDWDVLVPLLDMEKHASNSWDLALAKLLPFINGVHHVKRIAQLADLDTVLVKQCIEHLLYYKFAILIDIFQFSNVYAIRPQVSSLLDDEGIGSECAAYVTSPGSEPLPVPTLWRMYSQLRRSKTLHEWIDQHGAAVQQLDVRRFVTFGIIKGFLRRVHQYPVLVSAADDRTAEAEADWPKRSTDVIAPTSEQTAAQRADDPCARSAHSAWVQFAGASGLALNESNSDLETLLPMSMLSRVGEVPLRRASGHKTPPSGSGHGLTPTAADFAGLAHGAEHAARAEFGPTRMRASAPTVVPPGLTELLDGLHKDDELCVRFGMSWPELQRILQWIGSPYATGDIRRLGADDADARLSASEGRPRAEGPAPLTRMPSFRGGESVASLATHLSRSRGSLPRSLVDAAGHTSPTLNQHTDPFATRAVPSRVKIIAI